MSERPERSRRRLALAKEICNAEDETNKITQPQNYIARDRARAQSSEKKSNNDPPSDPPSPNPSSSLGPLEPLVPLGPLVLVAGAAPRLFKIWALRSVGSVEGVSEDPGGAKAAAGVDDG